MLWRSLCLISFLFVVSVNCQKIANDVGDNIKIATIKRLKLQGSNPQPVRSADFNVRSDDSNIRPVQYVDPNIQSIDFDVQFVQPVDDVQFVQPVGRDVQSIDSNVQFVQPVDRNVQFVDPNVQYVQYVDPNVQYVDSSIQYVQSVGPNVQQAGSNVQPIGSNVQFVQPVGSNVQFVQSVDANVQRTGPNVQFVQPVDPNVQYVDSSVRYVQSVGPNVQQADSNVQYANSNARSVNSNVQPVQSTDTNVHLVGSNIQFVKSADPNAQSGNLNVQFVKSVDSSVRSANSNARSVNSNVQSADPNVQSDNFNVQFVQPADSNVQYAKSNIQFVKSVDSNIRSTQPDDFNILNVQSVNSKVRSVPPTCPEPTYFKGSWELYCPDAGVSAMHLALLPLTSNCIMFDATVLNTSRILLPPGPCRPMMGTNEVDCKAHSIIFDYDNPKILPKPQRMKYDTWCSSGALDVNGRLVSTGGSMNGSKTVRYHENCREYCEWQEFPDTLAHERWYSTQVTLADGRFMLFGGRDFDSYEFVPLNGQKNTPQMAVDFPFLKQTRDPDEKNNLYPFVYLSTDGNLFVFANNRGVLLDQKGFKIVHEFPELKPGARTFPASAASVMLPLTLNPDENRLFIPTEVMICGGAPRDAHSKAEKLTPKVFVPANKDCAVIDITDKKATWKILTMPTPRVMSDAINLPTGDVILINGARAGTSGWGNAEDPNLNPLLYRLNAPFDAKFTELTPTNIPRMYQSTSALLPDGKILVAGSNTHNGYIYNKKYPTETRVEKFSPPYLDPKLNNVRNDIVLAKSADKISYGKRFEVTVRGGDAVLDKQKVQVVMYQIPFTTHGISMNQRLIRLGVYEVKQNGAGSATNTVVVQAPPNGNVAPPGYYLMFVVYNGVPSRRGSWVQIK